MRRVLAVACAAAVAVGDFAAPEFTVDLSKSAYERWAPILDNVLARRGYEHTWAPLHRYLESILPRKYWLELEPLWDKLLATFPSEYAEEVRALHQLMSERGFNWTLGQNVMVQIFYEVEDACTSIVAQNSNGTIFHARNLDYDLPGLQNITATITFMKGGLPAYRGTMYLGYVGVLTGQRLKSNLTGSWSVSLNEREVAKGLPYVGTIWNILRGVQNVGFFLRDALEQQPDYRSAISVLKSTPIPTPAYLTVGGIEKNEGVVITRDRTEPSNAGGTGRGFWPLNASVGAWYRLETNDDNWRPERDSRRGVANAAMNALGQDSVGLEGLLNVLSKHPVFNNETTFTAEMINEVGYYRTVVREQSSTLRSRVNDRAARSSAAMQEVLEWYRNGRFSSPAPSLYV